MDRRKQHKSERRHDARVEAMEEEDEEGEEG